MPQGCSQETKVSKETSEISKLSQVRKALENNPNITIVKIDEVNFLPHRYYWAFPRYSHKVEFSIAPKIPVYGASELQDLMMSLVASGLEPTRKKNFWESEKCDELNFGRLGFDEEFGEVSSRYEITLDNRKKESFSMEGLVDGKKVIEQTYRVHRVVWVLLFPDAAIAAYEKDPKYSIYTHDRNLEHYINVKSEDLKKEYLRRLFIPRKGFF